MAYRIAFGLGVTCATFVALAGGQASAACSNASLKGTYGVLINGTNGSGKPTAGLYLLKADGAGKITGSGMQNKGGTVTSNTISGTYKITAACTGTLKSSTGDTLDFVLDDANAHLQIIEAGGGDGISAGSGFLQGTVTCKVSGLTGTFGGGGILGATATTKPASAVGQVTYDGKGGATGAGVVYTGSNVFTTKATATYTVNASCFIAGTVKTSVSLGASVVATNTTHNASLLVNNGSQLLTIGTDPGGVNSGKSEK